MKKLVLIDGHALVHRAFHALPPTMSSPNGVPTNAVYGFVSVLIKTIKDINPDYIVATFDLAGPTFRHEEFAEYKAHREKAPDELHTQVPLVKEILGAFGIPVYEKEGFEADDLIGSIAEITKKQKDIQTIIATGDLDTLQLIQDDKVVVLTLKKGVTDTILYTQDEVEKRYGLKPEQMADFKGLKGDPSDNIPGVPGIGEKTASQLIQSFGSIENLYKEIEILKENPEKKPKPPLTVKLTDKLSEHKDIAIFSKKLATIIRDVPIKFDMANADWRKNMRQEDLTKMLQELGIYSLIKRIGEISGQTLESARTTVQVGGQLSLINEDSDKIEVISLESRNQISKLTERIKNAEYFAFDITIDPDLMDYGHIVFAFDDRQTLAIPWALFKKEKEVFLELKLVFEDARMRKIGHGLKELSKTLLEHNVHILGGDFDTKIAAYLLNSDLKDYDLDKIYFIEFNKNIDNNPLKRPAYCIELEKIQREKLKSRDLLWVFEKIEVPLAPVLAEMEINGVKINSKAIAKLSDKISDEISDLEKKIHELAGSPFNINSPQQLSSVLFDP
ncbi:MAG: 5'-3' exonuclease H3TH domain-containing protein, partial [Candidatus Nealsonbacteria bacterium]